MRYRVKVDLCFTEEAKARQAYNYLYWLLPEVSPIKGPEMEEGKFLQLELCRHDEGGSCEVLEDASR